MLKKFSILFLGLVLAGCSTNSSSRSGFDAFNSDISEVNFGSTTNFRVGVLLPLSGEAAKHGQGLKNATMMALEDVKNPNMILQFYDTKSTPSGARIAAENALNQRAQLIIGPLMSGSTRAITEQTTAKNVPVIAFGTSEEVLQPGIYTLGLLVSEQVNRIIGYAAQNGRSKFALLVPDNNTGIAVAKAAVIAAQKNDVEIKRIAFYPPNTTDFSEILKAMTDYPQRKARLDKIRSNLSYKAQNGDANAAKVLRRLQTLDTMGDVDFDAVLIPEYGPRLKSAASMFGYYDVFSPKVKFLGMAVWENTNLNKETTLNGSWYPSLSRTHSIYFSNKYADLFGERPSSLYSLAYDAIALSAALAKNADGDLNEQITNPDGYIGINGAFRLFENGTNEHSLDIVEVRQSGDEVIEKSPHKFLSSSEHKGAETIVVDENYRAPRIFGKDKYLAQTLIYGYQLNPENQPLGYIPAAEEHQLVKDSLKQYNVVIPDM